MTEVCAANGSRTAVEQSGASSMSDSLIAFHPAIEEPSNITPPLRKSSVIVRTWWAKCCHLPRGSVKRKSTYLTSCSLISSSTFAVSDITLARLGTIALPSAARAEGRTRSSHVVVEEELVGVRTQAHLVDLPGSLVAQMGVDHVRREYVALE